MEILQAVHGFYIHTRPAHIKERSGFYERRSRALPISISTEPTNTVPQSDSEPIQLVKHVTSIEISIR